ncbi:MAG: sodium:solute symporter [Kiritimatiellales bacterium]
MNVNLIDWVIIAGFFVLLIVISVTTNRLTRSVAGFLSSERCAGRYLLTMAQAMAFCAAIGMVAQFEGGYRNGLGNSWWGLMFIPIGMIISMSGWVTYRYRQTRAMTMAQFMEMRYSHKFRIFSGITAFFSGILNCAIFPMVTANFLIYFLGIPKHFPWLGINWSSYHLLMILMVGVAVTLAVAGGQITIMITDFFQGVVTNIACLSVIFFLLYKFGWSTIMDTLQASATVDVNASREIISNFSRTEGVSMLNPFTQTKLPDFGVAFFVMLLFQRFMQTGVWQGGAGYMTAAKTPHEGKMGNILGGWRWVVIMLTITALPIAAYVLVWNPAYEAELDPIRKVIAGISDTNVQSQMFVPIAMAYIFPAGLLGLFATFMIGAAVSTDDSAYHSWGGTFLQDVIMPFRKKPFSPEQHMKYLRWSIVGIGVFALLFSSIWQLKDYIIMWFQITGSIYVGGAGSAIIGGLYWNRGTTQGAWAGMLTGSGLSVAGIIVKQIWPELSFAGRTINGLHMATFSVLVSIACYVVVSLLTSRKPFNMDKLLHRGEYAIEGERITRNLKRSLIERILGITDEFSRSDKVVYYGMTLWTVFWSLVFIIGTAYNLSHTVSPEAWRKWWKIHLGILLSISVISTVWFTWGGIRDMFRLYRDLRVKNRDESDDGWV